MTCAARIAAPVGDRAREHDRPVVEAAHLVHQGERAQRAGVPPGAGADEDQPVDAGFERLLRVPHVDDVVHDDAAVGMHALTTASGRAQRGDDDRHLVPDADFHVVIDPVVGLVDDLVDRERRDPLAGMRAPGSRRASALMRRIQPSSSSFGRALSAGNEPTMPAVHCAMTSSGVGDDEHRRADDRQRELALQLQR